MLSQDVRRRDMAWKPAGTFDFDAVVEDSNLNIGSNAVVSMQYGVRNDLVEDQSGAFDVAGTTSGRLQPHVRRRPEIKAQSASTADMDRRPRVEDRRWDPFLVASPCKP